MEGWVGGNTINWGDAKEQEPLPKGIYYLKVAKAEAGQTKSGKECVNIQFTVDSAYGGEPGSFSRTVWDTLTFEGKNSDATRFLLLKAKRLADCLAVDLPQGTFFEALEAFAKDVTAVADPIAVALKVDTYEGRTSNKVEMYLPPAELEAALRKAANGKRNGF